jgi:hypothetical protein
MSRFGDGLQSPHHLMLQLVRLDHRELLLQTWMLKVDRGFPSAIGALQERRVLRLQSGSFCISALGHIEHASYHVNVGFHGIPMAG